MRVSSTRRGTFPLRNPGMRTSEASFLKAASTALSNVGASTSTWSLTLWVSTDSTEVRTGTATEYSPRYPPAVRVLRRRLLELSAIYHLLAPDHSLCTDRSTRVH